MLLPALFKKSPPLCSRCLHYVSSQTHCFHPRFTSNQSFSQQPLSKSFSFSQEPLSKSFSFFRQPFTKSCYHRNRVDRQQLTNNNNNFSKRSIHLNAPQNAGLNLKNLGLKSDKAGFGVIKPDSNVIGLVHPELMNRQRVRYPLAWLTCAYVTGLGVYMQFSDADYAPMIGAALQLFPLYFISTMWYNARCVGKMVLNDDSTVTVSHLNMFGRRANQTVPLSDLQLMTKRDHKQWIGGKVLFINWDNFKTNDQLWEFVIPAQKQRVLIADDTKKRR